MIRRNDQFRRFIHSVATTLPDITGAPCHLRRVKVHVRLTGDVAAYAKPYMEEAHFTWATRRSINRLLTAKEPFQDPSRQERFIENVTNQATAITHELLHLRYSSVQAEQNMELEDEYEGLNEFEEALTTLLSHMALPEVIERCGFATAIPHIRDLIAENQDCDYDYVIVPMLEILLEAAAQKNGLSAHALLDAVKHAPHEYAAAQLIISPLIPVDADIEETMRSVLKLFIDGQEAYNTFLDVLENEDITLQSHEQILDEAAPIRDVFCTHLSAILDIEPPQRFSSSQAPEGSKPPSACILPSHFIMPEKFR